MTPPSEPQRDALSEHIVALGRTLRDLRLASGMSVEALAAVSGVSAGSISQLENGRGNPSFLTLRRLADGLKIPVGQFLQGGDTGPIVVRADERKRLRLPTENGLVYELLTPDLRGSLEVLRSQIPAGFDNRDRPFQHTGEECVHLLEGALEVAIGNHRYALAEGDSVTYDAATPHWWRNVTADRAVIIGAVTPPSF